MRFDTSALDIVCYYADLGRPYRPLIERMTESAAAVYPDARRICITPTPDAVEGAGFDLLVVSPAACTPMNICLERARAIASWATQSPRSTLFVDVDVRFQNPIDFSDTDWDVQLLWREDKAAQPVNSGLVIVAPGFPDFWRRYLKTAFNLPPQLHSWFCDQLAFSIMVGACHKAGAWVVIEHATVLLTAQNDLCPPLEHATPSSPMVHYKGRSKGPGWDNIFAKKSGAGKP